MMGNGACGTPGCERESRWPKRGRISGFCDECLFALVADCGATVISLGDDARSRFRTRHDPCAAIVDVSFPMIRRGGWVCQMCKWAAHGQWNRDSGFENLSSAWPVAKQEQLLAAASMRSIHPLGDQDGNDPLNVECLDCGAAISMAKSPSDGRRTLADQGSLCVGRFGGRIRRAFPFPFSRNYGPHAA